MKEVQKSVLKEIMDDMRRASRETTKTRRQKKPAETDNPEDAPEEESK